MRSLVHFPLLAGLLLGIGTAAAGAQRPLKVFISADMEGVAGAVTGDQLGPGGFEYERFRGFMTAEVLAAIQGARDAGATTILVADSHGNGENLLIERLPDDVMIVRAWPRPLMMMQGIDSSFAAAMFIGYHASTTSPVGVRAHTISSANYTALALNGVNMSEASLSAAIAGNFGVPVVMISGDDAAVAEARALLGNIEGAVVKRAISFHSATTMTPQAAQALIREAARRGVERRGELRPYVVSKPVRLDLTFKNYLQAEVASFLPDMERPTAHSVRYTGRDIVVVSRLIEFLGMYAPELRP
jgi:D-amino peptidase